MISIKSLVKEHIRIEEAERKLRQRRYALKDKIERTNIGTCVDIIDGVVWKLGWSNGRYEITKVGKINEKT